MSTRKAYTFKCSDILQNAMLDIMEERQLDRTSVIKLALYMLASYMSRERTRALSLHEIVADIEHSAPPSYPPYSDFGK